MLPGATKGFATVTPQGEVLRDLIEGVRVREGRNVVTPRSTTVEVHRSDWEDGAVAIGQVIHVTMNGHAISAWHCHERQTDRIFVTNGTLRLVLYDARDGSPTRGRVNEFLLSPMRPTLVTVPPGVWHGVQNVASATAAFVNLFNAPYCHDDPDEWRLPADTDAIPYRF